ncbi:hypothetical protein [Melioribacter sp. OK-6-Me]|uniref:hypothetical protein n=1 Tax=unclassified Melioribacter TaxID=2627329 RepID=UPI003EDAC902
MKNIRWCVIFLPLIIFACSSATLLEKSEVTNVVIDANPSEWNGKFFNFDEKNIGVAYTNDKDNLYLCFIFKEFRSFLPVLRGGLTLWIESDNHKIGLKFPMVYRERIREDFNREMLMDRDEMRKMFEERLHKFLENQKEIEIVNEENYPLTLINKSENKYGIKAEINQLKSEFVYELKLPVDTGLIKTDKDKVILMKLETEEPTKMPADFEGGMRGNRIGSRLPRFASMIEPIELEFSLKLIQ